MGEGGLENEFFLWFFLALRGFSEWAPNLVSTLLILFGFNLRSLFVCMLDQLGAIREPSLAFSGFLESHMWPKTIKKQLVFQ